MTDYEKNHLSVDDFLVPLGGDLLRIKNNAETEAGGEGEEVLWLALNRRAFHGLVPRSMCRAALRQA